VEFAPVGRILSIRWRARSVLTEASAARSWSVAALLLAVSDALQARLGAVSVRGELSGFTRAASGHCYFTLKDGDGQAAVLRCAMFRRAAMLMDFRPADGQQVELRGRIGVYEARGELQCVVESMQRLGAGTLYELFLRTRARLEAAGLFDAARKRPIDSHPRRIGVVTSLGAAALHDVLTAIARRAPHVQVIVYPAPVQGAEAPPQLAQAIHRAGERAEVDTLIVCRGGGSLEDLWAFNDEQVVRAVAGCPVPVVCGVGHETDVCLAELAADLRAPTPTAAAELATPRRADELQRLDRLQSLLSSAVQRRLDGHAQRLDRLALRLGRPARLVDRERARLLALAQRAEAALAQALRLRRWRLEPLQSRLCAAAARRVDGERERLSHLAVRLDAADPRRVLARGYAWLADSGGHAVTSARSLRPGQRLSACWADGSAEVDVVRIDPESLAKDVSRR
jgi:exodeoxyribonuclease VII large subunit